MGTVFMNYVLPFRLMSFWGATVITNSLSPFPSLTEWVCGGRHAYNPTLKRFFCFHFQFPCLLGGFIFFICSSSFLSFNSPWGNLINSKSPPPPFIFQSDLFGFIILLFLYLLQTHFGNSYYSHPDN